MNRELTFPHLSGRLKRFFSAHSFLFLLYFPLFFVLFELSESGRFIQSYHTIEIIFDRYIPFCSVFVVPYIAWFVLSAAWRPIPTFSKNGNSCTI